MSVFLLLRLCGARSGLCVLLVKICSTYRVLCGVLDALFGKWVFRLINYAENFYTRVD